MFLLMWLSQTVDDQQGGRTWNQENKINIKRLLPFITPAHTMYTSIKHFKEQTFNSKVVKFRTSKGTRFFYWRHLVPNLSSHLPNITTPINSSHGFHELSKRLKTWCRHSQRHTYHFTETMLIDRCLFKLTVVSYWFNVSTYLKRLY